MTPSPDAPHTPPQKRKRSKGISVLYPKKAEQNAPPKTFIIFGVPRGGTSSVAGTLMRLGIDIGQDLGKNHEDRDFLPQETEHVISMIKSRNASKDVWGWKYPEAGRYLEDVIAHVRNPHLVLVCRDPAALMQGLTRWHEMTPEDALLHSIEAQMKNFELIRKLQLPTAVVSYEKILIYPGRFIRQLANFADLPQPGKPLIRQIAAFLEPGAYKPAETV